MPWQPSVFSQIGSLHESDVHSRDKESNKFKFGSKTVSSLIRKQAIIMRAINYLKRCIIPIPYPRFWNNTNGLMARRQKKYLETEDPKQ